MDTALPLHLQEILFTGGAIPTADKQILRLAKEGKLRRLTAGVYTSNLRDTPEAVVRRHLFAIVSHLYPGILLSHRSALEFAPTTSGQLFVTHKYTRTVQLPGIALRLLEGPEPVDGDNKIFGELFASGQSRALLENMQPTRQSGPDSKVLSKAEVETRLETVLRVKGEDGLNALRDDASRVAATLGFSVEFQKLNRLISALLSTGPVKRLSSPAAIARALGEPYDADRLDLFNTLFAALQRTECADVADENLAPAAFENFAFFEAYFSNYIEGTTFKVEEAEAIVESGQPFPGRREDSHDILGTYRIVSSPQEMATVPATPDDLMRILRYRHAVLMAARADKQPGAFKDRDNFAGETQFVAHDLVLGTLKKGFEFYAGLRHPFAKAAFMMFLVSEVHPFLDGNGRIARVMMNAELVAVGQARIIIPTVYRDDYLGALRRLTRQRDPEPYIRMLGRAQLFSAGLRAEVRDDLKAQLTGAHAFSEPKEGKLTF